MMEEKFNILEESMKSNSDKMEEMKEKFNLKLLLKNHKLKKENEDTNHYHVAIEVDFGMQRDCLGNGRRVVSKITNYKKVNKCLERSDSRTFHSASDFNNMTKILIEIIHKSIKKNTVEEITKHYEKKRKNWNTKCLLKSIQIRYNLYKVTQRNPNKKEYRDIFLNIEIG
ncbi:hypothetical protein WA026_022249 [Henosepilachna vigintioctopunctata]|uniref:Uncharacterized protein n=1 Tax=Henosepilachna vigintioctopunctata TaxID=420089 RepID=A0AAW1UHU9_9CUCU